MTSQNTHHLKYYLEQVCKAANDVQKIVCENNNIKLENATGADITAIPVYEDDKYSLLTHANETGFAELIFPTNEYEFLPAYYKKYQLNGETKIKIVVSTDNYCEARFFAAKELMHCYIADNGISATNSVEKINKLVQNMSANFRANPESIADEVAWMGAAVYLIPDEWIKTLRNIRERIIVESPIDAENANFHLAQLIRAPEIVVRIRLDSD